jgi:hypothetical protein
MVVIDQQQQQLKTTNQCKETDEMDGSPICSLLELACKTVNPTKSAQD